MTDAAILVLMTWNALLSVWWASGAFRVATRESPFRWPVPWRWLVVGWMVTKAQLFVVLDVAIGVGVPEWVAVLTVVEFTVCHTWAWWRWRNLPDAGAASGGMGER